MKNAGHSEGREEKDGKSMQIAELEQSVNSTGVSTKHQKKIVEKSKWLVDHDRENLERWILSACWNSLNTGLRRLHFILHTRTNHEKIAYDENCI